MSVLMESMNTYLDEFVVVDVDANNAGGVRGALGIEISVDVEHVVILDASDARRLAKSLRRAAKQGPWFTETWWAYSDSNGGSQITVSGDVPYTGRRSEDACVYVRVRLDDPVLLDEKDARKLARLLSRAAVALNEALRVASS